MFSEIMLVGTLDGKDPTTKCHWEKIMLDIPTFSYFLTSGALDFVVLVLNYFPIQKELCSAFCSCKKKYMHLHFVYVHPVHSALYLRNPAAQLLPPYLNPDEFSSN